ncbi:MAG: histidine kinase [Saprospiraceae bacterium]|nr:histidine kinase [Saprospiraceae bacterium]
MNSRIKKFFSNQIVIVLGHILAWVFVLFLPIVMPLRKPPPMINRPPMPQPENMPLIEQFFWMHLVSNMPLVGFFYLNYYVLIPKILYRRTTNWYILSLIGCGIIFYYYNYITRQMLFGEQFNFSPFFGLFPILFILALSLALRVTTDRLREEREHKEQETEGLKSELAFLRSQVSPHFLFNMMNNVVALSRVKPQLVEPTLIQLSHLMRYMLYESDENKVSLEKEMEYLENYIALQKMRFSKNVDIQFHKNNLEDTEGVAIEPMLLIPFVENAFKHGVVLITEPFIKINVMLVDKILIFNVINKYSSEVNEEKDAASGIGLRNVMRRLEQCFFKLVLNSVMFAQRNATLRTALC